MIKAIGIDKSFGDPPTQVLFGVSFEIQSGSFVAVTGRSGSGKSTLLYILSTLDQPTRGEVSFDGASLSGFSDKELHEFRNQKMGFIFQFHYLLPELTALENVLMPARKLGLRNEKQKRAMDLLKRFDIGTKWDRLPKQLSGGEQQRVAIARSMIMEPRYLFADEPTGNLDSVNGEVVMKILKEITENRESTVLYVTHDPDFASMANHQIVLADGRVVKDIKTP